MNEQTENRVSLQELIDMCNELPNKVSIAKKSALDRAAAELGLMTGDEIKKFIGDGLEDPIFYRYSDSEQNVGTKITEYKFNSGRKKCYLAFHRAVGKTENIHIKSFHLDDANPSLGTFRDIFSAALSGDNNE